jgi:excisionase family DNA binding protein
MDRAMTAHHGADTAQDRADFITVAEAARRLGVSSTTVKRRIAAGTLEAEQLRRPQGFE